MSHTLDAVFSALADPTRRAILTMLLEDDMAVTDVAEPFEMSLAAISKHLGILSRAGLISQEPRGRVKWCKLQPDALREASVWMQGFGQFEPVNLDAFERFLAAEFANTADPQTPQIRHRPPPRRRTAQTARMHSVTPLTVDHLPPPHVERLQNALVMPMEPGPENACGVVRADGSFRDMSRTLLSGSRLSGTPALEPDAFADIQPGRWLFAGIGRHHFGHFLVETLIRLWAVRPYHDELDGIVIIPKHGMDFGVALKRHYGPFLSLLTDRLPVHLATYPTRFETLLLPSPGFGPLGWVEGTEVFRDELRARVARSIAPDGPEKLYISRALLGKEEKRVHDEEKIEAILERAGYTIFHPERHSIADQLACYRTARTIIGGDGSAFHLAPFALEEGARVGLIQRRHRPKVYDAFTTQLQAFAKAEVVPIQPVLPKTAATPHPSEAATPIDVEIVADDLAAAGFI